MLSQYRRLVKNISDDCKKSPASLPAAYTLFYANYMVLLYALFPYISKAFILSIAHIRLILWLFCDFWGQTRVNLICILGTISIALRRTKSPVGTFFAHTLQKERSSFI